MELVKTQTIEFQSYQGLQRVVDSTTGIYKPLITLIEWLREIKYCEFDLDDECNHIQEERKYRKSVRLLDTFLVGSMQESTLQALIRDAREFQFPIQILLLDPFCSLARSRAKYFPTPNQASPNQKNQYAISYVNESLHNILKAVREIVSADELNINQIEIPEIFPTSSSDLKERLNCLDEIKEKGVVNLEIKFYEEQTEVPVYIVSRFVAKGLVFPNKKASRNPWLIFIDNKTQKDDIYDAFSKSFDEIWEKYSTTRPQDPQRTTPATSNGLNSKNIFIIHGHNHQAREDIELILRRNNINPIILAHEANQGDTVVEKFERHSDVTHAIALFTRDDIGGSVKDVGKLDSLNNLEKIAYRARQNVLIEAGYFMSKLGRERLTILAENAIEIPSDYQGMISIKMDENDEWKRKLLLELQTCGFTIDLRSLSE